MTFQAEAFEPKMIDFTFIDIKEFYPNRKQKGKSFFTHYCKEGGVAKKGRV